MSACISARPSSVSGDAPDWSSSCLRDSAAVRTISMASLRLWRVMRARLSTGRRYAVGRAPCGLRVRREQHHFVILRGS